MVRFSLLLAVTLVALSACTPKKGDQADAGASSAGTRTKPDRPSGTLTLRFLDVGQGDAVLVTTSDGKTMLYDGGRSTTRMRAHLQAFGVHQVDLMVASHADFDHIAGLEAVAKDAKVRYFVNSGLAGTTDTWRRLVDALQAQKTTFVKASARTFTLGDATVQILPPPAGMPDDQNLNSVGVLVKFGAFRALMTGDSETAETKAWLAAGALDGLGPVNVYKSIHHGAANGDNAAWLAAVQPQNVVIGVGKNNYGHPTRTALNLYKSVGAKVYRTDRNGTVTVTVQADGSFELQPERP
ncbi:ComEC/Rec2 family competence protein [Deinococcus maricopensis]|uniref:Beta-lactamase domain protein n=1 Tax=Deinococcus maricopensis (strain DSM 21211 / LMG 22137 / NRRL B-23946 / LB-34) TaxID=709986 RepID=E8U5I7_DEIML|nr:ComEC/Rec2 family competence protein [Deinococcus maricopensis]ADV66326.1 beta-lactamase domain protein [Deinococcus maricopensis DSM 21211]